MNNLIRIKNLISSLNNYSHQYYTLNQPTISDETYDTLYEELLQLEKSTNIILSNSPTQNVGGKVLDKFTKVTHDNPLLSLDKTKDINKLKSFTNGKEAILMLKLDGLTIDLTYDNGELIQATTRGNGEIGEDVTNNVKTFTNVPLKIEFKEKLHVIGEAIITYDIFEEINSKLTDDNKYKNCRNLSSGSIRQLDSTICKNRKVKFVAYNSNGLHTGQKVFELVKLVELGFDVVEYYYLPFIGELDELNKIVQSLRDDADNLNMPIDGLVVAYNDIQFGKSLGKTSHHPLHSMAFKFNEDVEFTKLLDIEFSVGRTGNICPVAVFEPVELCGTTVERASLHNLSILKGFKLGIGDEIGVVKKNEIIPQLVDNLTKSDTFKIIDRCPICNELVDIEESDSGVEVVMCNNDNCKGKLLGKIVHYCSRNAMNIEGLSEKTIEKFIEIGLLNGITDIYNLSLKEHIICNLEGFGDKSYTKLIESIEKSKNCKLENFIFGLGIPNVGKSTSKSLVEFTKGNNSLDTLANILSLNVSDLMRMKDCGNIVAHSIFTWFNDTINANMLSLLIGFCIKFEEKLEVKVESSNILNGEIFVITGTVNIYKNRKDIQSIIESLGGSVVGSVSSKTNYLINNDIMSNSSKNKKAKDLGVKIINEEEFRDMIKKGDKHFE